MEDIRPGIPERHGLNPYDMESPLKTICTWHSSTLPLVVRRFEFWFFLGLHITLSRLISSGYLELSTLIIGSEPWKIVGIITGLLSFFSIFFAGQCYTRYTALYSACRTIFSCLQSICCIMSVHAPDDMDSRWQGARYLTASALVMYARVNDGDMAKQKIDDDEWERMLSLEVITLDPLKPAIVCDPCLTKEEVSELKDFSGSTSILLCTWAMHVYKRALTQAQCEVVIHMQVYDRLADLVAALGFVMNTLGQPIPFAYYHMLVLLQFLNYCLLTTVLVGEDNEWTLAILGAVILILTGLREVAVAMTDPFGSDDSDLPVEKFVRELRAMTTYIGLAETNPPSAARRVCRVPKLPGGNPAPQSTHPQVKASSHKDLQPPPPPSEWF